jgi:hypothetical protein
MRKILISLGIIVLTSLSCTKENSDLYESTGITGKWKLIYSYGMMGKIDASYMDYIRIDEYTKDSIFRLYNDDSLILECKFSIQKSQYPYSYFSDTMEIKFDGCYNTRNFEIVNKDTLVIIIPLANDLGPFVYKREK